jgi:hypothetical protein
LRSAKEDDEDLYEEFDPNNELGEGNLESEQDEDFSFEALLQMKTATTAALQKEDPSEVREDDASLPPLPEENEKNYPQENKAYFDKKNYCRKDKYLLEEIIALQSNFQACSLPFKRCQNSVKTTVMPVWSWLSIDLFR